MDTARCFTLATAPLLNSGNPSWTTPNRLPSVKAVDRALTSWFSRPEDLDTLDLSSFQNVGVSRLQASPNVNGWRSVLLDQASANGARLRLVEVSLGTNTWPLAGDEWPAAPQPGTLRLRQVAVLVNDLDAALSRWGDTVRSPSHQAIPGQLHGPGDSRSPDCSGRDTFVELAQPTGPDAPSQRFLDRYGEGIYLTIYEIADSLDTDARLVEQGARFTSSRQTANYTNLDSTASGSTRLALWEPSPSCPRFSPQTTPGRPRETTGTGHSHRWSHFHEVFVKLAVDAPNKSL